MMIFVNTAVVTDKKKKNLIFKSSQNYISFIQLNKMSNSHLTIFGATIAITSGLMLGTGFSLLDETNLTTTTQLKKYFKTGIATSLIFSGIYLASPSFLRYMWKTDP